MSLLEVLEHPLGRALTLALVHFLWQGLAVAAALIGAVELLRIRRATSRYAASLIALVAMILCPLATLGWLLMTMDADVTAVTDDALWEPAAWSAKAATTPVHVIRLSAMQPYLLVAWLAGVSLLAVRLLAGAVGLARLRRRRQALPLDLNALVRRLGKQLQIDALPLVFLSREVGEAMAVGLIRPLVLVPAAWATEMPLEMLEAVIAHELAHLKRRDLWINLVQRIVETLLFYHPAVWWLSRRLRIERELCADELAVAATGRRLAFAQALQQIAARRRASVRPQLAAFMRGERNMRLLQRVRNVLGDPPGERSRLWPAGIVALALPLSLWIASLGLSTVTADDDQGDRPAAQRDRDDDNDDRDERRRERDDDDDDDREQGRPQRDDDNDRDEARRDRDDDDREVRRDGKFRREGPRDGEGPRRPGPRDGEFRRDPRRGPVEGGPREGGPRDRGPREGGPPPRFRDLDIGPPPFGPGGREAARIEELSAMVKRLSMQVERMQDELNALRAEKEPRGDSSKRLLDETRSRKKDALTEKVERRYSEALNEKLREAPERKAPESRKPDAERKPEKEAAEASQDATALARYKEALLLRDRELERAASAEKDARVAADQARKQAERAKEAARQALEKAQLEKELKKPQ